MLRYMGAIDDKTLVVTSGNYSFFSLFPIHLDSFMIIISKCGISPSKCHSIIQLVIFLSFIYRCISFISCFQVKTKIEKR